MNERLMELIHEMVDYFEDALLNRCGLESSDAFNAWRLARNMAKELDKMDNEPEKAMRIYLYDSGWLGVDGYCCDKLENLYKASSIGLHDIKKFTACPFCLARVIVVEWMDERNTSTGEQ